MTAHSSLGQQSLGDEIDIWLYSWADKAGRGTKTAALCSRLHSSLIGLLAGD
jgi:hypothetical protein